MSRLLAVAVLAASAACTVEAAPSGHHPPVGRPIRDPVGAPIRNPAPATPVPPPAPAPAPAPTPAPPTSPAAPALAKVAELCVTKGAARIGATITEPTMRAVALGSAGDNAALTFVYRGDSEKTRALATSGNRRQLGLKLRAANGCNLVYVMWRLDPTPMIEVSVKRNPGAKTHADCGANGYRKIKPAKKSEIPVLVAGGRHTLRAAITGDELTAWIDDGVAWRGTLPKDARTLSGPAGVRSDNLEFDLVSFAARPGDPAQAPASCHAEDTD